MNKLTLALIATIGLKALNLSATVVFTDPSNNFRYSVPFGGGTVVTVFASNLSSTPQPVTIINSSASSPYPGFTVPSPSNFIIPALSTERITVIIDTSMFVSNPGYMPSYNDDYFIVWGSTNPPNVITQTLTVTFIEPDIEVSPTTINLTLEKDATTTATFNIANVGSNGTTLVWSAANNGPITLSANTGTLTAPASTTITATINSSTLPLGLTTHVINVTTPDDPDEQTTPVTFNITVIQPRVSITASPTSINEGGTSTFTVSRLNIGTSPLTVNLSLTGSAGFSASSDLNATGPSTVTIPANSNSVSFSRTAVEDCITEGVESFTYTVTTGTGYTPAPPTSATVTINDTSTSAVLTVSGTPNPVDEGQTFTYTVTRSSAPINSPLTVNLSYAFGPGFTPLSDLGVSTLPSTLTIPAMASSASLTFTPVADLLTEGPETFTITITSGSCYTVPASPSLIVTVNDTSRTPVPNLNITTGPTIDVTLPLNSTGTATLCIQNDGQPSSTLTYNLARLAGWITGFSPNSGSLTHNATQCITVSLTTAATSLPLVNAAPVTYCEYIEVYSNDPDYPAGVPELVRICLTVTPGNPSPGADLSVANRNMNVARLCPNYVTTLSNQVLNLGSGYVNWTAYSFDPNITVLPSIGSTQNGTPTPINIHINAIGRGPGTYIAQIRVQNNDSISDFEIIEINYTIEALALCSLPGRHIQIQEFVSVNAPPCTTVPVSVPVASVGDSTLTITNINVNTLHSHVLSTVPPTSFSLAPNANGTVNFNINTCAIPAGSCFYAEAFVPNDDTDPSDRNKVVKFLICVPANPTLDWDVLPKSFPITNVLQGTGASVSGTIHNYSTTLPLNYISVPSALSSLTTVGFTTITGGSGTLAPNSNSPITYNFFAGIGATPAVYFRGVVFFNTADGSFRFVSIPMRVVQTTTPPAISVNPLNITVYVNPGNSTTFSPFVISNTANSTIPLLAQVDATSLPSWLTTNTSLQTINSLDNVSLVLNFDATNITTQTTLCQQIRVNALNDPSTPVTNVNVCMVVVNGGPQINVPPPANHVTSPNTTSNMPVQVCSTGTFPLNVSNITSSISWVVPSTTSAIIMPGDCSTINFSVNTSGPVCPGVYSGNITINSNDPNNPVLTVPFVIEVTGGNFTLAPSTILLETYAGGTSTVSNVLFSNNGTTPGNYNITNVAPSWLNQLNVSGSVAANGTATIGFSGNATNITSNTTLSHTVVISHSNPCQPALQTNVILDVCGQSYALWLANYPTLIGPDAAALADPDGDGWQNIVEYAMGMNPTINDANKPTEPRFNVVNLGNGVVQTTIEFTLRTCEYERGAFDLILEGSTDMINWTPIPIGTPVSQSGNLSYYSVVHTAGTHHFFRFRITLP